MPIGFTYFSNNNLMLVSLHKYNYFLLLDIDIDCQLPFLWSSQAKYRKNLRLMFKAIWLLFAADDYPAGSSACLSAESTLAGQSAGPDPVESHWDDPEISQIYISRPNM